MANLKVLVSFNGSNGSDPYGGLLLDGDGDLLGTTDGGGADSDGTVFEIDNTATGYASTPTTLISFDGADGSKPKGGLIADDNGDLFGTANGGGNGFLGAGAAFEVARTGTGFASTPTVLADFGAGEAGYPVGDLVADKEGDLIGAASGISGEGSVFEIAKTSAGYASTFTSLSLASVGSPSGLAIDANGDLFGTMSSLTGGATVFEIAKTAAGYAGTATTLVSLGSAGSPDGDLIVDANGDLFGTTSSGGAYGDGTVFEIVRTASGYASTPTTLVSFDGADGADPDGGLVLDANGDLFGTTSSGGANGDGTGFEIAETAAGYAASAQTLISFSGADGADPIGSLIVDAAGDLFGTTEEGGANGDGSVFEITGSGYALPTSPRPVVTLAASPAVDNGRTTIMGTAAPGANGDPLSVTLTKDADFVSGSTLALANGSLVYTPGVITAADVGTDTLYYAVTDTVTGASAFETQSVTLSNGPPPVVTLATTPTASNTASATLGTAAAGFDGDPLKVTLNSDADFASGSKLTLSNGALVYTPGVVTAALAGMDTLKYTITDTATGAATSETQTVTLSNGPAPIVTLATAPTASNSTSATLGAAQAAFDGDPLTVTLISDADFVSGSKIALDNGDLVYTPGVVTAALAGADTVEYTVTDTVTGAVTSQSQTVTLSDGPPPVVALVASPTATDAAPATLATATPAYDNDPLAVTLVSDADFANGSSLVLNDGFLTYTPGTITAALIGATDTLKYTVTDAVTGALTTESETVTLSNGAAPVVLLVASPAATDTAPATLAAATLGYDSDPLKVTLVSDADFVTGSSLALNNGRLVYTPGTITPTLSGATDTLKYLVTDTVTGATTAETQKVTLSSAATLETYSIKEAYSPSSNGSSTFTGTFQFNVSINEITNINGALYDSVFLKDIPLDSSTMQSAYFSNSGTSYPPETSANIQTYSFQSGLAYSDSYADVFDLAIVTTNPTEEWSLPNNILYTNDLTTSTHWVANVSSYAIELLSPPAITGTVAGQTTTSEAPVKPFPIATISDANSGATDTLTITLSGSGGTLSGSGLVSKGSGVYTLTGAAATVTSELDALSFTPAVGAPGAASTTTFTLSDLSSAYATPTVDKSTTVIDQDPSAVAPTVTGAVAGQTTTSEAAVSPFAKVAITDPNAGATDILTITLSGSGGALSGTGLSGSGQTCTLTGSAAQITSELDKLAFTPNAAWPQPSATTTFTLSDLSSADATPAVNSTTTVVDKEPAGAIAISAAYLAANIDGINRDAQVASITLTDLGLPQLSLTDAQATGDTTALGEVTNPLFEVLAPGRAPTYDAGGNGATGTPIAVSASTSVVNLKANSTMALTGSGDRVSSGANSTFSVAGGGDSLDFVGAADVASLSGTSGGWDTVAGSAGTVDLASAGANITGGGDTVDFFSGASNSASLINTVSAWDIVKSANGATGTVYLSSAGANITGGGDTVDFFSGASNSASLINTVSAWDIVKSANGATGTVYLSSAGANITGGGDTVDFFAGANNSASLINTVSAWDTVKSANGATGTVYLTNAGANIAGGGDTVDFFGGANNSASLINTVTASDTVKSANGATGTVYLTSASASISGSGDTIDVFGGASNSASLSGTDDTLSFQQPHFGLDTVSGYGSSDKPLVFAKADQGLLAISQSGANTLITLDASDVVTLTNCLGPVSIAYHS